MIKNNLSLTSPDVLKTITKKKKIFENYNIKRMNDLMTHLSFNKSKLFNTIPFLLHINSPDFPGYINDDDCVYGIFGFHDSGFWKIILKQKKIDEKILHPYLSKKFHIVGLYLMGSSGTLAQSKNSDFDYWVIIDQDTCSKDQIALLDRKLKMIKNWAYAKFHHEVNFFILGVNDIKSNRYTDVDEESSGTAQRTILKEEFYRTFILIAGKVPYWAVLPASLDDPTYNKMVALSVEFDKDHKIKETYIDLGNLTAIRKSECPGAILWQLYKAHIDPAKALIKASLIAYYNFFPDDHQLPCDTMKDKYPDSILSSSLSDPYAIMFDRVISFLDHFSPDTYSDQIRECIFLRLNGYLSSSDKDMEIPRQKLLKAYTEDWHWPYQKIEKFRSYADWPEEEKNAYDESIINKISLLFNAVMKRVDESKIRIDMKPTDFNNLRNRIARSFKIKQDKLPRCSTFLSAKASGCLLKVSYELTKDGGKWRVYNTPENLKKEAVILYDGPELLRSVGWIIANELFAGHPQNIAFQQNMEGVTAKNARRLFFKGFQLLRHLNYHEIDFSIPPVPLRLLAVLDTQSFYTPDSLKNCEFLIQNTWGELFYSHIKLAHLKDMNEKCLEIAEYIRKYTEDSPDESFTYKIIHLKIHKDNDVIVKIKELITGKNKLQVPFHDSAMSPSLGTTLIDQPFLLDR